MNLSKCFTHALLLVSLLLTPLFTPLTAHAQTATWTNQAGGNWSVAGNWDTGVSPGPGTNVLLTNPYYLYTPGYPIGYIATNDVLNNTIGNLTIYDLSGYRAVLYSAQNGFNPAGDVSLGYAGTLMISNSTATIGGSMTISNYGQLVVLDNANVTVNGTLDNSFGVWIQGSNTVLSVLGGFNNSAASGYPYLPYAPYDLMFFNNDPNGGTLNIGGTNAASANASSVTFTNTGSITFNGFSSGYPVYSPQVYSNTGTINASTNQVGLYNAGTIQNYIYGGGNINATLVNATTNSAIKTGDYGGRWVIERFTTNRGSVIMGTQNGSTITVNKGDFVNEGFVYMGLSSFSVLGGAFINDTNGVLNTAWYATTINAQSALNRGTIAVTSDYVQSLKFNCVLTNDVPGTISLYRGNYIGFGRSIYGAIEANNIVNYGTIKALGESNVFTYKSSSTFMNMIYNGVTNMPGGVITTTNGAILGFYPSATALPKNYGTIIVNADSTIGMGAYSSSYYDDLPGGYPPKILYAGLSDFRNDGTIDLRGGTFGANSVSNAGGATIQGNGDVGYATYSNLVSGSLLTSNYVKQFTAKPIANSGTIAPNGVLNAGAVNNLAGGQIIGSGTINSYDIVNYLDGETLVTSNAYTGARIQNNAGATILASGGTLVLSNSLVNNSNAGTIGATSGGTLQLGDGTVALTNNGTIRLAGGGLTVGNVRNNGSIHLLAGGANTLAVGGALTLASGSTMSASNSASTVSGIVTNQGTIRVVNSTIAYTDKMFGAGRYISDPSTNTFFNDVTIAPSGTLEGGLGDVFDFKKNLIINSTNTSLFDLVSSTVSFSGGGDHTNAITGLDFDNDPFYSETYGYTATNFAYGTLMLGASDNLYLIDGDGNPSNSNGLYISVLDIGGTTNNLSLLHTPFNIYYRNGLAGNEYLGGLTYSLDGGGLLIAIPEPSTAMLLLSAGAILLRRRSR